METKENVLNKGIDPTPLLGFRSAVEKDPSKADRNPTVVAEWVSGDRSRVTFGEIETFLGGEDTMNPMQMLLGCLAACDVDLVTMHASFIGLKVESLRIEVSGHFNVQSYIGIENAPGSGYDQIAYTIYLKAPEATPEQIEYLIERCERSSPVGDSLERAIPTKLEFNIE